MNIGLLNPIKKKKTGRRSFAQYVTALFKCGPDLSFVRKRKLRVCRKTFGAQGVRQALTQIEVNDGKYF